MQTITLTDWMNAGLTKRQFYSDSQKGCLKINCRRWRGATTIDAGSITRPDRLKRLEDYLGALKDKMDNQSGQLLRLYRDSTERIERIEAGLKQITELLILQQTASQSQTGNGNLLDMLQIVLGEKPKSVWPQPVRDPAVRHSLLAWAARQAITPSQERLQRYENRIAIYGACHKRYQELCAARAKGTTRLSMQEWFPAALQYYSEQAAKPETAADPITSIAHFERVWYKYLAAVKTGDWKTFAHSGQGNRCAVKVTKQMEKIWLSLYADEHKPFVEEIYETYNRFLEGKQEIFDRQTGEVFKPYEKHYKEVSKTTIFNHLKKIPNIIVAYRRRERSFKENNLMNPHHERKNGDFALSQISMDDVTLSRRTAKGEVNLYTYTDVVSGYAFPAAYTESKPTVKLVEEAHRNMMRELRQFNLPKPAESDNEHHLVKSIEWWPKFWDYVHFNANARSKTQEHFNRQQKYDVKKKLKQILLRWYGKGAYAGVRFKQNGDFKEKIFDFKQLVADDLRARDVWNSQLHPDQKKFPGMTRRDVLLQHFNRHLSNITPWYHYRMFCAPTKTSICTNRRIKCNNQVFWLQDVEALQLLKPNDYKVQAYFLTPDEQGGNVDRIYLYQGDTYIGEAFDVEDKRYNKCTVEQNDKDRENFLFQNKEDAKFRKFVKEQRSEKLIKIGVSNIYDDSKAETENAGAGFARPNEWITNETGQPDSKKIKPDEDQWLVTQAGGNAPQNQGVDYNKPIVDCADCEALLIDIY